MLEIDHAALHSTVHIARGKELRWAACRSLTLKTKTHSYNCPSDDVIMCTKGYGEQGTSPPIITHPMHTHINPHTYLYNPLTKLEIYFHPGTGGEGSRLPIALSARHPSLQFWQKTVCVCYQLPLFNFHIQMLRFQTKTLCVFLFHEKTTITNNNNNKTNKTFQMF